MQMRRVLKMKPRTPNTARGEREGGIWEILLFAVLFVLAFSVIARAEPGGGPSMAMSMPLPSASAFAFSANIDWTTSRKLLDNEQDKPGFSGAYDSTFKIAHKDSGISLMAEIEYDQEYTYERDDGSGGSFANPLFVLAKTWKNKKDFNSWAFDTVSASVHGVLPGNSAAYNKTFLGGAGPGVAATKKIGRWNLGESLGYTRNAYQFQTAGGDAGAANSPDSYMSISILRYSITDKWTWCSILLYGYKIPYFGNATGNQDFQSTIGYQLTKNFSIAVGIDTSRGTTADDQQEQVRLYDENSTQAIVTFSASI